MRGVNKDYRQLVRTYQRQGWTVTPTKGGHLCWRGPQGQLVFSGSTPSERRARWHLEAHLKRPETRRQSP
jgi:hypothetical protein